MKRSALALVALFALGAGASAQVVPNPAIPPNTVCSYLASAPTLTNGQASWLRCDNTGALITTASGGGGGSVTQGTVPWVVSGQGTAGTAATGVVTVQGIASMTPFLTTTTLNAETTKVIGTVNQGTSPWVTSGTSTVSGTITANQGTSPWVVSGSLTTTPSGTQAVSSVDGALTTLGAEADAICSTATGTCTTQALLKFLNTAATSAIPAGTNIIGKVGIDQTTPGTTNAVAATLNAETTKVIGTVNQGTSPWVVSGTVTSSSADPCQSTTPTYTPISMTSATTLRIVAPTSAKRTYVCYLFMLSAIANNVAIVEGTGGTCGSGTAGVVGGTTAANGLNLAANSGAVFQDGGNVAIATAGTNVDLCLITSAAGPLAGHIKWVQAP